MITISLLNMKGGVGKTTLAVNLAWTYRKRKKRVLLVDLDPQFNASQYLMTYDAWESHRKNKGTVADILLDSQRPRMQLNAAKSTKATSKQPAEIRYLHTVDGGAKSGLWLLPSELELSRAIKSPQGVEFRLQKALDNLAPYFDYVFIDSAPTDSVLTVAALMASQFVLVPMKPDRFSILGYGLMDNVLDDFRRTYPDPKNVQALGVVFTLVSNKPGKIETKCKTDVAKSASYVFKAELKVSNSYLRSVHEQSPIEDTRYAKQATRQSIVSLADELDARLEAIKSAAEAIQ
jgi:chromosome partitioning protein